MTSSDNGESITSDSDGFVVVQPHDSGDGLEDLMQADSPTIPDESHSLVLENVIFFNVQRVYSLDQEIRVCFERSDVFAGSEGDYIALCSVENSDSADVISSELVPSPQSLCPNFVILKFSDAIIASRSFSYEDYFEFRYVLSDTRTVKGVSPKFHLIRSLRNEGSLPLQSFVRDRTSVSSPLVSLAPEPCCKCIELNAVKNQLEAALETKSLLTSELNDKNERLEHLSNVYEANLKEVRNLHTESLQKDTEIKSLVETNESQVLAITDFTRSLYEKGRKIEELTKELKEVNLERDNLFAQISSFSERDTSSARDTRMSADVKEEYEARIAVLESEKSRLQLEVADKEAWVSSLGEELARMADHSSKALQDKEEGDKQAREVAQELDLLRTDMSRMNTELLDSKDELAESQARYASLEEATNDSTRHYELRILHFKSEIESLKERIASHVTRLADITQEHDLLVDEHSKTTQRLNTVENEAEEHRIQMMQLQLKKQECEDEVQQLRASLKKLRSTPVAQKENPTTSTEVRDADVLMKYLPSLTQTLIGISNTETSPSTQKVIKELRDMIRFLLTAHEKMKGEIQRLRNT